MLKTHLANFVIMQMSINDPMVRMMQRLSYELFQLQNQGELFEINEKQNARRTKKVKNLAAKISRLKNENEELKINKIHSRRGPTEAARILHIPQIPGPIFKRSIGTNKRPFV